MTTALSQTPRPGGGSPIALVAAAPALSLMGIEKTWRRPPRTVLHDIRLVLQPGDLVHIHGANGAGKTTLLRIVAGMLAPDAGAVDFHGLDPERDRRRYQSRVAFLSGTGAGLYARLTVRGHLRLWSALAFLPRAERSEATARAASRFDLEGLLERRADRLSTGQRQRLRLAMTFLHAPELVLLDEPEAALDDNGRALLAAAVEGVLARRGCAIWCTPATSDGPRAGARCYRLHEGRLERG